MHNIKLNLNLIMFFNTYTRCDFKNIINNLNKLDFDNVFLIHIQDVILKI